uniref:Uncharacterized protein n=1 Tax=Acrobeloides nanus TaxID=290746 RepID=A0A914CV08_9BILA
MKHFLLAVIFSSLIAVALSAICKCGPINYNCNGPDATCCTWEEPLGTDNCGCCSSRALNESVPAPKALLSPIVIKFKKPDPNSPNAKFFDKQPFHINFGR